MKTVTARLDAYDIYAATLALDRPRRRRCRTGTSGGAAPASGAPAGATTRRRLRDAVRGPRHRLEAHRAVRAVLRRDDVPEPRRRPGARARRARRTPSVHLDAVPGAERRWLDDVVARALSPKVRAVRDLVSLGLQVRTQASSRCASRFAGRTRSSSTPMLAGSAVQQLRGAERLAVDPCPRARREFVEFRVKPSSGARARGLGKEAQALKASMASCRPDAALFATKVLAAIGAARAAEAGSADVDMEFVAKEGFAAAGDRAASSFSIRSSTRALDLGLSGARAAEPRSGRAEGARAGSRIGSGSSSRRGPPAGGGAARYASALARKCSQTNISSAWCRSGAVGCHGKSSRNESVKIGIQRA